MTEDPLYGPASRVLSPQLYSQLVKNFPGGVLIANEGEPFQAVTRRRADGSTYVDVQYGGEYYRVNCPFCRDTRHRLWVNHRYGTVGEHGQKMLFLATCYNEGCLAESDNWRRFNDALFGFRNANVRDIPAFVTDYSHVGFSDTAAETRAVLPGEVIPMTQLLQISPRHPAVLYMCGQRRYTRTKLDRYEVGFCTQAAAEYRPAQGRIIFPLRMDGELVGWQARIVGDDVPCGVPKYYGMPRMKKRRILANYDYAKREPFPVIVEGVTDQHVVGAAGVAILGKTLSSFQRDLLASTWPQGSVVILLDGEAVRERQVMAEQLQAVGLTPVVVALPEGYDCGDYETTTLWNLIEQGRTLQGLSGRENL